MQVMKQVEHQQQGEQVDPEQEELQHEDQGEQQLAARPRRQAVIEADNRHMTQDILIRDMEEQMAYHAEQLDVTAVKELMSLISETQDNVD
jgi:hypothetical protein